LGSSGNQEEDVEKVRRATELVKSRRPDLKIERANRTDAARKIQARENRNFQHPK